MRAWQVQAAGEPAEVLHLVEREVPTPGPGEVRIRVTAAGLGLPDVFMCRGTYPLTPPLPFTSGQEATGVVTAVGEGVDRLAVGDHIMCVTSFIGGNGSFAEECLTFADGAFPVPEGLSAAEAAGFWIPHLTGWIGLVDRGRIAGRRRAGRARRRRRQRHRRGAARPRPRRTGHRGRERRRARRRSAASSAPTTTLNHRDGPVAPALRELTEGRGVDLVYDPVGGALAEDAAGALARHGRLLAVGFASGRVAGVPDPQPGGHQHVAGRRVRGRLLARRARRHPRAASPRSCADGRLRNAVTDRGAVRRAAPGAPTHGRPRRGRQARDGAVTIPSLDATGKVVVVTGGSKGLGRAMALGFAEAGADVVVASRKLEPCEIVAEEVRALGRRALPVSCHVGDWDQCAALDRRRRSPSSAGSTCSSTTPASRRCRRRCST